MKSSTKFVGIDSNTMKWLRYKGFSIVPILVLISALLIPSGCGTTAPNSEVDEILHRGDRAFALRPQVNLGDIPALHNNVLERFYTGLETREIDRDAFTFRIVSATNAELERLGLVEVVSLEQVRVFIALIDELSKNRTSNLYNFTESELRGLLNILVEKQKLSTEEARQIAAVYSAPNTTPPHSWSGPARTFQSLMLFSKQFWAKRGTFAHRSECDHDEACDDKDWTEKSAVWLADGAGVILGAGWGPLGMALGPIVASAIWDVVLIDLELPEGDDTPSGPPPGPYNSPGVPVKME